MLEVYACAVIKANKQKGRQIKSKQKKSSEKQLHVS